MGNGFPAISPSGEVIGLGDDNGSFAFMYDNGIMTRFGGRYTEPAAINAGGQIVGTDVTGLDVYAFLYSGGVEQNLGILPGYNGSYATGINSAGQVVGYCEPHPGGAFLYGNGNLTDLNNLLAAGSGWTLDSAYAINDSVRLSARDTTAARPGPFS